ncbi:MAG: arsenic metallochaperone ArsD family protein [Eubacterium sp.]|nr:arsenic metallochaperone ArsD family protein [Eubacterium sp.]
MKHIAIYEPTDGSQKPAELLQIKLVVQSLQKIGVDISIHNIWDEPNLYAEVHPLERVLLGEGVESLPVTIVGSEVYKKGCYPDYAELLKWSESRD